MNRQGRIIEITRAMITSVCQKHELATNQNKLFATPFAKPLATPAAARFAKPFAKQLAKPLASKYGLFANKMMNKKNHVQRRRH